MVIGYSSEVAFGAPDVSSDGALIEYFSSTVRLCFMKSLNVSSDP